LWVRCFRPSYGLVLWMAALVSTVWAIGQKEQPRLRSLAILSVLIFLFLACQVQSQNGDPVVSRLCLALLGLGCFFIVSFVQVLPRSQWLLGAAMVLLVGKAILYDLHFVADRPPHDNASLAGLWITQNVPAGQTLSHYEVIPHVVDFPPVDFERYKIVD